MGVYHQGGVIPAQIWLGQQRALHSAEVFWWRTYSPPVWLLDGNRIRVTDLMGASPEAMISRIRAGVDGEGCGGLGVGLVAPRSSMELDTWMQGEGDRDLVFEELWIYRRHVGLDDLDLVGDGVWDSVQRVFGRRGLTIWRVGKRCSSVVASGGGADDGHSRGVDGDGASNDEGEAVMERGELKA